MKTTSQSLPDGGIDQSENVIFTLLPGGASILKQKVRFLSLIGRAVKFDPVLTFLRHFLGPSPVLTPPCPCQIFPPVQVQSTPLHPGPSTVHSRT